MNTISKSELVTLLNSAGDAISQALDCSKTLDCWRDAHRDMNSTVREDAANATRNLAHALSENAGRIVTFMLTYGFASSEKDSIDIRQMVQDDLVCLYKLVAQLKSTTNTSPWKVRFIPGLEIVSYYSSLAATVV